MSTWPEEPEESGRKIGGVKAESGTSRLRARFETTRMDEYPVGSLDHSVPLLHTLGTRTGSTYDSGLSAALKEQAVLILSLIHI